MSNENTIMDDVPKHILVPSFISELLNALLFAVKRYDLLFVTLLCVSAPTLPLILMPYLLQYFSIESLLFSYVILNIAVIPILIIGGLITLHASSSLDDNISLLQSFKFIFKNFFSLLYLGILMILIIYGALLFLFIPALFVTGYLILTFAVFINEGKTGMSAVYRSHQLVRGHGVYLFNRFVILFAFVLVIIFGISTYFTEWSLYILIFLQALTTLVFYKMSGQFYKILSQKEVVKPAPIKVYKFLSFVGFTLIAGIILASIYFGLDT